MSEPTRARQLIEQLGPSSGPAPLAIAHISTNELYELVMTLEERFGIQIPLEVVGGFVTLQDLIDYVETVVADHD